MYIAIYFGVQNNSLKTLMVERYCGRRLGEREGERKRENKGNNATVIADVCQME
jgi:hypothetical protein